MTRQIKWTPKKRNNARFVQNIAADCGIVLTREEALHHFKRIKANTPKGTRDTATEVYYEAKEYFTV